MVDRIDIEDGKYTVVIDDDGAHLLRYGDPWGEPPGQLTYGKMIIAMAYELQSLRNKVPDGVTTRGHHNHCPFCGGTVDSHGWLQGDGKTGPECNNCGATAPDMATWQQRVYLGVSQANVDVILTLENKIKACDAAADMDGNVIPDESKKACAQAAKFYRRVLALILGYGQVLAHVHTHLTCDEDFDADELKRDLQTLDGGRWVDTETLLRNCRAWGPIMAHHKDGKYRLAWVPWTGDPTQGDPVAVRWASACGWRDAHGDEWSPTLITDAIIEGPHGKQTEV